MREIVFSCVLGEQTVVILGFLKSSNSQPLVAPQLQYGITNTTLDTQMLEGRQCSKLCLGSFWKFIQNR